MDQQPLFTFAFAPTLAGGKVSSPEHVEPFRLYLAQALERPVHTIIPGSYQETLDALRADRADAAMVGDYVSRHAEATGGIEQLVAPVSASHESQTYRSAVVTRIDSGIRDMAALRGVRLGLVDGQSTSGFLVPRAMLREAGLDPDRDVPIHLYGSHRAVVEAVIAGEVAAGAAHESRIRPATLAQGPDFARLRILAESHPIPAGPLVVRTTLDPDTRARLSDAMLRIHEDDPAAARIMLRHGHRFTLAATRSNPRSRASPPSRGFPTLPFRVSSMPRVTWRRPPLNGSGRSSTNWATHPTVTPGCCSAGSCQWWGWWCRSGLLPRLRNWPHSSSCSGSNSRRLGFRSCSARSATTSPAARSWTWFVTSGWERSSSAGSTPPIPGSSPWPGPVTR